MYEFPVIEGYDDVKDALDDKLFVVKRTDDHIIINYILPSSETFPPVTDRNSAIRREFRGLTFDARTGKLVARKYHKFFNVNENEETQAHSLPWTEHHYVMEKLDGSMIVPVPVRNGMEWHTKMGMTDVARLVIPFIDAHPRYMSFAHEMHDNGFTPIFEFVSPKQRIVLPYETDNLILTAIRHTVNGYYLPYEEMVKIAENFSIPVVKVYEDRAGVDFLSKVRDEQDKEGYVVRFHNGHMVKIKTEWYVRIHKCMDEMRIQRKALKYLLDENLDDILAFMSPELNGKIRRWVSDVTENINNYVDFIHGFVNEAMNEIGNRPDARKVFALEYADKLNSVDKGIAFQLFGRRMKREDVYRHVVNFVKKNLGSTRQCEKISHIWKSNIQDYLGFMEE